jgi:hypothetical protein
MHNLKIVVRVKDRDEMLRTIVPIAHDKGFFMSSRISELSEFHLSQHLDWFVSKESAGSGGSQRLNACAIVRRKPKYYIRNYILVVFMLSSSSFSAFLARPEDYETRAVVIFTVLLSVVAFKYNAGEEIPRVPYSTIFEAYVILNFYALLGIGFLTFGFSMVCGMGGTESGNDKKVQRDVTCSRVPGRLYSMDFIWQYDPVYETCTGLIVFAIWLFCNSWYWNGIMENFHQNVAAVNDSGLKWLKFKYVEGEEGLFPVERYVLWKEDEKKLAQEAAAVAAEVAAGEKTLHSPQSYTPPARLFQADSFASISSDTSMTSTVTDASTSNNNISALTSPALKNLKIDADGVARDSPDTVNSMKSVPKVPLTSKTSMNLDGLIDTHVADVTL